MEDFHLIKCIKSLLKIKGHIFNHILELKLLQEQRILLFQQEILINFYAFCFAILLYQILLPARSQLILFLHSQIYLKIIDFLTLNLYDKYDCRANNSYFIYKNLILKLHHEYN